jgi:hypothetical protein
VPSRSLRRPRVATSPSRQTDTWMSPRDLFSMKALRRSGDDKFRDFSRMQTSVA